MRVVFGRAERVGKPVRRAAGTKRCLLAFMRCPAGQRDDLETRRNSSIRRGKPVMIDFSRTQKQLPATWCTTSPEKRVLLTHSAQVCHQAEHVGIGDGQPVGIGHRQRKAGTSEKATGITSSR